MLLRRDVADAIAAGQIDMQFRLWRKPTVKAGGRLRTVVGELMILGVEEIDLSDPTSVTADDARRSGFASVEEVRLSLVPRAAEPPKKKQQQQQQKQQKQPTTRSRTARPDETSRPYRVTLRFEGADSRMALREDVEPEAITTLIDRLDAMDGRSSRGAWTRRTLELISLWPGRRAPELAQMDGRETVAFKNDVRKLKELGLTISLSVGYELSPRGRAVLGRRAE